MKTLRLTSADS